MKIKIISQIRFYFTQRKSEPYLFWYKILGFYPQNLALYNEALSHKSALVRNEAGKLISNERLEYLGDAILNSIISELLYTKYPTQNEGFLTTARSKIVCRKNLNQIAKQLGFTKYIIQKNIAENVENIHGNALEALIGAIYIDRGYSVCQQFILQKLFDTQVIDLNKVITRETNSKSRLLEWAQKRKKKVVFEFVEERFSPENNQHLFFYNVLIDGKIMTRSSGVTKQQAQQNAAKTCLNKLNYRQNKTDSRG